MQMMRLALTVPLLILAGCGRSESEWVYVPADGYRSEVKISVPASGRVGEEIVLQAQRSSGPWRRAKKSEVKVEEGVVLWTQEPPAYEEGYLVTANLRWEVRPSGSAVFETHGMSERTVKFSAPGRYRLQGFSAFPTRSASNEVEIEIRE